MRYKELDRIVEVLKSRFRVRAVILFGSRARGDWGPWSDYDLLIIGDFKEKYLDRIKNILDTLKDTPLPIEPHPYTLSEAVNMLRRGNPLIIDALEEGVVLYDRGNTVRVLKEILEELKKRGLRRTNTSIIVPKL
ncbi:MAG: nucleotidyltransferase domain-containing protein [Thermoprotei archaeon]